MTFRSLWQRFRDFDRRGLLVERVQGHLAFTQRGYVINRRIFQAYIAIVILAIIALGLLSGVGWREAYAHCPVGTVGKCWNPCFEKEGRCSSINNQEFLLPGETLGVEPNTDFQNGLRALIFFILGGAFLAFAMNHLMHNRGRPFKYLFPKLEVEQ